MQVHCRWQTAYSEGVQGQGKPLDLRLSLKQYFLDNDLSFTFSNPPHTPPLHQMRRTLIRQLAHKCHYDPSHECVKPRHGWMHIILSVQGVRLTMCTLECSDILCTRKRCIARLIFWPDRYLNLQVRCKDDRDILVRVDSAFPSHLCVGSAFMASSKGSTGLFQWQNKRKS